MDFSLDILRDVLEEVQGLDVLEQGLDGFKARLMEMEESAIAKLMEQGIPSGAVEACIARDKDRPGQRPGAFLALLISGVS